MTLGPTTPAPNAFGIDSDLESALLAGLANLSDATPEEPGGAAGDRAAPRPGAGSRAAGSAPPPGRAESEKPEDVEEAKSEPGDGTSGAGHPAAGAELPLNGSPAPSSGLEEAIGGAFPEPSPPSAEVRDAATGERRPNGPFDPSPVDVAPEETPPFAFEPETAPRSGLTLDEGPAEVPPLSLAAPDTPPERFRLPESRDGLPDRSGLGGLLEDEPAAFESSFDPGPDFEFDIEPSFEPDIDTDTGAREEEGSAGPSSASVADWKSPAVEADPELKWTLRDGLSPGGPLPGDPTAPAPGAEPDSGLPPSSGPGSTPPPEPLVLDPEGEPKGRSEPDRGYSVPEGVLLVPGTPAAPAVEPAPPFAAEPAAAPREESPAAGGEPAVLAFATDSESESALREGLSEHPNPQVWPGGLRSAIATLGAGQSSPLLFVDLDETAYPAGAIHELAAVCEVGTVVVAFGSDGTARFSREVLLAGVSDYLVKPITAASVREAAARAAASAARGGEAEDPDGGRSVGFAGTGGSGATTLAAAAAVAAAERGRYVSVLDLNRTFPALCFLLDVEPAPGLVELLSTAARASLHPELVDRMRVERSDRIAVYGYPWSAVPPPPPPVWAICELLVELQRRSHLVIVDGLDDPATRISLLATLDTRVLVVEPTAAGAASAARLLARFEPMFEPGWPLLLVQNHTRALKAKTGARTLRDAGVDASPDAVVPFEPALPGHADRGWPEGGLPKPLRKPLAAFADRLFAAAAAGAAPAATPTPA